MQIPDKNLAPTLLEVKSVPDQDPTTVQLDTTAARSTTLNETMILLDFYRIPFTLASTQEDDSRNCLQRSKHGV